MMPFSFRAVLIECIEVLDIAMSTACGRVIVRELSVVSEA